MTKSAGIKYKGFWAYNYLIFFWGVNNMVINKQRAVELGLVTNVDDCLGCMYCEERNGEPYCTSAKKYVDNTLETVECPGIDEQRLQQEMTEEEWDAFHHNRLTVETQNV